MLKLTSLAALVIFIGFSSSSIQAKTELTIATVNNGHMIEMQKLSKVFEEKNPTIKLRWVTLEEGMLRQRVTTDIASKNGRFDVMTIGMYEAPIWGKKGWLREIKDDSRYDADDILPTIRSGLSVNGKMYAVPFYGESSMVMYRKDLVERAGMSIEDNASWTHIHNVAAAIHDPDNGIYGICLRGKPGWGDNIAFITTMANSFGARWFDENWKPQLNTPAWKNAVSLYVDLLQNYGPPGSSSNSFNDILALFNDGKCGIWIDATIAASFVSDPNQSKVAANVAFAQAPIAVTKRGSNWLWAWALAIPASSKNADIAEKFVKWATSKEYIALVAKENGWANVPTGTRTSTYASDDFQKAAVFAKAEFAAIQSADPENSTLEPSPYTGIQFAAIPEFQAIGIVTGQQISSALAGKISVEEALQNANKSAEREMQRSGYY